MKTAKYSFKKIILSTALFFSLTTLLHAQSTPVVTKIAVVDIQVVYNETNKSSPGMARLEEMKTRMEQDIKKRQEKIQDLKQQRLEASNENDTQKVSMLDRQIRQSENELRQFYSNAQRQLEQASSNIKIDNNFKEMIHRAIISVSERNGYSVVLANNASLLYWSPQVDISGEVITQVNRMIEQQGRQ
jgi:Skp family chaperone for outer membrane proteins